MKHPSRLKNQGGQVIVEYVLLMVVMLGIGMLVQKGLKDANLFQSFAFEPWQRLNGMAQCGTWSPCGVEVKKGGLHPNTKERVLSLDSSSL